MYKSYFLLVLLLALILSCTPKRDSSSEPPSQDTVVLRDTLRIRDTLSSESPKVYVSADKMNIIYVGVDNPISIETEGLDPEELNPNISGDVGGKIKKTGPHNFMVTVRTSRYPTKKFSCEKNT